MSDPPSPRTPDDAAIPAGIQSRVDAAAFALLREGKNPTVALVRERMGGGSPNIVAPALQCWRLTFAAQLDQNAGSALEVLPPGVLEIVQALWSRALFEAHRVADESRSAADTLEQLNALIDELRKRVVRLKEREAALDAERRSLELERKRAAQTTSAQSRVVKQTRKFKRPARGRPEPPRKPRATAKTRRGRRSRRGD